ncbi:hypothetical protein [Streptomyces violaceusniger]|uniref:hypothetical protein n=1 Tax=Streptomyces violaceusniger TaxID=68280 RepID=UPI00382D82A0
MTTLRLIDPNGYTVPGTVNSRVPAANEAKVRAHLLTDVAPAHAAEHAYAGYDPRDYRVQAA